MTNPTTNPTTNKPTDVNRIGVKDLNHHFPIITGLSVPALRINCGAQKFKP